MFAGCKNESSRNIELLAIAGDVSPGQELREGTLGSGNEKHKDARVPGGLGKRGAECAVEGAVRKGSCFWTLCPGEALELSPERKQRQKREHTSFLLCATESGYAYSID